MRYETAKHDVKGKELKEFGEAVQLGREHGSSETVDGKLIPAGENRRNKCRISNSNCAMDLLFCIRSNFCEEMSCIFSVILLKTRVSR